MRSFLLNIFPNIDKFFFEQLLSDEGIEVFKRIIHNSKVDMSGDSKSSRGNKRIIRGLYYSSKWVRDLQNSQKLRKFFETIAGEELVPHPSFSNSPQVILIVYFIHH